MPENSGLQKFNYLASRYLPRATLKKVRGEDICELVETYGGYGWTGNDLYQDYLVSGKNRVKVIKYLPWPEKTSPRLCLLGPQEEKLSSFIPDFYSYFGKVRVAIPDKYYNLALAYFSNQAWTPSLVVRGGQVDRQIQQGNVDLAIDIVYSGKTIEEEKLCVYDTVFDQAGLVLLTKDI